MKNHVYVVIPTVNGAEDLAASVRSVMAQSYKKRTIVVVDNGSTDDTRAVIQTLQQDDPGIIAIYRDQNYGYTGGVNPGFELALEDPKAAYVAPFNNDAVADKDWLIHLVTFLDHHPTHGIAACTILHADGKTIDSTADQYTIWGIPFPRGRDEPTSSRYNDTIDIFGASGGASMYRLDMIRQIGVLDQDFFAYYEDIDISFRAQLAGWKVAFVPDSVVYHSQGKTSTRLGGRTAGDRSANPFTTKQFMKNLPYILIKDVPSDLLWRIGPRFLLAYTMFFLRAFTDGRGWPAVQGVVLFWARLPRKLRERRHIQRTRAVSSDYLWSMFVHDLPPNAHKLRRLRSLWHRLQGKRT